MFASGGVSRLGRGQGEQTVLGVPTLPRRAKRSHSSTRTESYAGSFSARWMSCTGCKTHIVVLGSLCRGTAGFQEDDCFTSSLRALVQHQKPYASWTAFLQSSRQATSWLKTSPPSIPSRVLAHDLPSHNSQATPGANALKPAGGKHPTSPSEVPGWGHLWVPPET